MTSKEALEKIIKHPAWNYAAIHGMNKVDDELVEAIEIIKNDLDLLEQYKSIEQELGIDLITLIKVFTDGYHCIFIEGYYCKGWSDSIYHDRVCEFRKYHDGWGFSSDDGLIYYISDYGKTWALTKEELEGNK